MTSEHWKKSADLLRKALDVQPSRREEFLRGVCRNDPALRRNVESMLRLTTQDTPPIRPDPLKDLLAAGQRPDDVGPYRILGVLGEGGMGVVYAAEQLDPIRRSVALKLIKLGMKSEEVLSRFEAERQALALMNHQNIARVYDAGVAADGCPYFAMERVDGVSIFDYCDRNQLSIPQRLRLFVQVCHGIQHAHGRGIIHRDIKPSNILVAIQDGQPVAKIIDFGVAKATNLRLTQKTFYTDFGRLIGTPGYMSPEQTNLTKVAVDHRTDVYSLGVVLYELLVGEPPLERESLDKAALDELFRRIREEEAPPPSTRLTRLNSERSTRLASARNTKPGSLRRDLRGNLDWICVKAIEKDPGRRYRTVALLASDIERHLRGEPVRARPPGTLYRMKKFVGRHRGPVAAAVAIAAALLIGLVASIRFATEAKQLLDEVFQLHEARDIERYVLEARDFRATSSETREMAAWLERARKLAANVERRRGTLSRLQEKALPYDRDQQDRNRRSHPRFEELLQLDKRIDSLKAEFRSYQADGHSSDRATVLSCGDVKAEKHPAYYFRIRFPLDSPDAIRVLRFHYFVNDGIVLYLNGRELFRDHMPAGQPRFQTLSTRTRWEKNDDYQTRDVALPPRAAWLMTTLNLLAVEVHQRSRRSADLAFDLELTGFRGKTDSRPAAIVSFESIWRYHDLGKYPGKGWQRPQYNDSSWPTGRGCFGYGFESKSRHGGNEGQPEKFDGANGRMAEINSRILPELERKRARLEVQVSKRRTWIFSNPKDQWWHDALFELIDGLEAFTASDPHQGVIKSVERRLAFARSVRAQTIGKQQDSWQKAIASISDPAQCPAYKGLKIDPQEGLIPIWRNPESCLWEFAHLESGRVPEVKAGELLITRKTGLVLVLLPGGQFDMGAFRPINVEYRRKKIVVTADTRWTLTNRLGINPGDEVVSINGQKVESLEDVYETLAQLRTTEDVIIQVNRNGQRMTFSGKLGRNADMLARADEGPVQQVTLDPFFISKYEMNQAQWFRLTGRNPSQFVPNAILAGEHQSVLQPVESVNWETCRRVLQQLCLKLPTEAQWEYAARARTSTPWWTGSEKLLLKRAANLADDSCRRVGSATMKYEQWNDGYVATSPVGEFRANLFGLHDVLGNVWEWCLDAKVDYSDYSARPGDGLRSLHGIAHVMRGGCYYTTSDVARCASRSSNPGQKISNYTGVRPARALR